MSDDWFSFKLAPDGSTEDGCHPEEAEAMKNYLHHRTTASEAARAITRPIVAADNPREDLARLWAFLEDCLVELPVEHTEALVELLKAIEDLPEPHFTAVDEEGRRPYEKLWKGLCGFGHMWSDSYQAGNWKTAAAAAKGPERDALRDEHIRKAEMEARLVTAGIGGIPIDWGYETVTDALERRDALLDFEVPAATRWIVICGQRFRQGAENGEESWALDPGRTKPSMVLQSDFGRPPADGAMSLERWSWWERRLKELQEKHSGVVQDAATTALDAMRKAAHMPS
jgi:hypothetical protein